MNELIFDDVTRSRIRAGRLAGALAEALGLPVAVDVEQQRGRVERVTVTRLDGQPFSAEQAITARLLLDTHDPDRPSREEQEIAVLSMHLLQMCMVYINTLMIQQVLAEPDWQNRLEPEDLRALTPLIYAHVNPYGRFYLDMDERLPLED